VLDKQPNPSSTSNQGRILIIEDDPTNRDYLTYLLQRYHHVESVADGQAALDKLKHDSFDVLLLDIMMPGMNGYAVLDALRSGPATADLPVIMISALATPHDVAKGLDRGANDYITKPVEAPVILARVKTQLQMKRLIDERKNHINQLEATEKIRKQIARIISHDLKNPLHNLRLAEHLLREELANDPRIRQLLDNISVTVDNIEHMIGDFVDLVEIQTDSLKLNLEPLSLHDAANNAVMLHEIAAQNKQIEVNTGTIAGHVFADSRRMVQVLSNLISNALKYSDSGSRIRLWTEQQNERVRLCVADCGPGIPENERHKLFQEFGRLSPRPTAGESSTGLGLWIVKHLMAKQGGNAGVYFPETGGSVFYVEMPLYVAEAAEIA